MGRIMLTGLMLLLCIGVSVGNDLSSRSGDDEKCGPYKYYDEQRLVCLDLCGRYNETRCTIDRYCSTTVSWSNRINPPRCLPNCIRRCDSPQYCNHEDSDCRPCDSLCSRPDITQCRKYCYDVYLLLTTTSQDIATSQDITTSQTTTIGMDRTNLDAPCEDLTQNHSWKTIAMMLSCVSVILMFRLVGAIICYCQKSASTTGVLLRSSMLILQCPTCGEAGKRLLSTEKQGEPDTPHIDKMKVNLA